MRTSFILAPVSPFRLDYTVWALRRISKNLIDRWDGNEYTRLFVIQNKPVKVVVKQCGTPDDSVIDVSVNKKINQELKNELAEILEMMLGLKQDLRNFYRISKKDEYLNSLVNQFKGFKPPRFPTVFEALVNAISCQQISFEAGLQIQNRLIQKIGIQIAEDNNLFYAFPDPGSLACCSVKELRRIGYSLRKSEALIHLASSILKEGNLFDGLGAMSNDDIINRLCKYNGVGRWTAEYVLLRGMGKIDVFPRDDIGAQNNLQDLLHLVNKPDYGAISKIIRKWHPYAGLVYFHLLLRKLNQKGVLINANDKSQASI
ncbi:DNA-3-methyladenine glycosylase [Aquicella siphonis]|uniref:DNA-3-methyladenine glycosylase II n=1 Tax=Aquicella siphonis TaxID=254247 RepID=A0A5E4PGB0_9COXI|nr:DNA-3-methyladenine glycosylase [Aquicella siphonis]VVC75386.1 DNA-3-methyladenine glycosylase [Aquicella siphonis]